jgi:hypothetical protein
VLSDQIAYDLEFHFTSGPVLYASVLQGRDSLEEKKGLFKVTVRPEDGPETTLTVHTDKLNAVQSTTRIIPPENKTPEPQ